MRDKITLACTECNRRTFMIQRKTKRMIQTELK